MLSSSLPCVHCEWLKWFSTWWHSFSFTLSPEEINALSPCRQTTLTSKAPWHSLFPLIFRMVRRKNLRGLWGCWEVRPTWCRTTDWHPVPYSSGFPRGSDSKESTCDARYPDLIPGLGRSHGEGNGNPLHYFTWRIPWAEEPDRL